MVIPVHEHYKFVKNSHLLQHTKTFIFTGKNYHLPLCIHYIVILLAETLNFSLTYIVQDIIFFKK